jgi:hypothetical protein
VRGRQPRLQAKCHIGNRSFSRRIRGRDGRRPAAVPRSGKTFLSGARPWRTVEVRSPASRDSLG